MSLYTDNHPKTTIHGLGFKDEKKAKESIKILNNKVKTKEITLIRMMQTVNTMLNRAKYHPHQTEGMRQAMKIYEDWMKKYLLKKSTVSNKV